MATFPKIVESLIRQGWALSEGCGTGYARLTKGGKIKEVTTMPNGKAKVTDKD